MQKLVFLTFCAALLFAAQCGALRPKSLDFTGLSSDIMGSSGLPIRSSLLRSALDEETCNITTCGNRNVRQKWPRRNCAGSDSVFYVAGEPGCTEYGSDSSSLYTCDAQVLGFWTYVGSKSCEASSRFQFTGYGVGICINDDEEDPESTSYVFWCNFGDAFKGKNVNDTTPVDRSVVNAAQVASPCPASDPFCSKAILTESWTASNSCSGSNATLETAFPFIPNITTDKCYFYNFSDSIFDANLRATCGDDLLTVTLTRGCGANSRPVQVIKMDKKNCISPDGVSSVRMRCTRNNGASGLQASSLLVLFVFGLLSLLLA